MKAFLVYCGAKGECIYILSFKATLDKIYTTYPFLRTIPAKVLISIHDYTLYARDNMPYLMILMRCMPCLPIQTLCKADDLEKSTSPMPTA